MKNKENMKMIYGNKLEKFIGGFILIIAIIIFCFRGVNEINNIVISYDEAYNATVSANLAKYGEYKVSYPSDIVFYNKITTGQTVLVPTAIMYRLFGINDITSAIIPLIYSIGCFILLFILLCELFEKNKFKHVISAVVVCLAFLSDFYFFYSSTRLIGETASLFFVLLCMLGITLYIKKNQDVYMLMSGASIIATYLTKSSMIFILVTFWGVIFITTFLEKRFSKKAFGYFTIGNVISFVLIDLIKLVQLGGVKNYLKWYKDEWFNMLNQSSGIDTTMSFSDKMGTFQTLLSSNTLINIFLIALPVIIYIAVFIINILRKGNANKNVTAFVFGGIAGSSLLVYYVLLGGPGLNYPRRLSVNTMMIKVYWLAFIIYFFCNWIEKIMEKIGIQYLMRGLISVAAIGVIAIITILPLDVIKTSYNRYMNSYELPEYSYGLMQEFLEEVSSLPEDATLYVNGWWQEPDVTLLLEKKMTDINTTDSNSIIRNNSYLLIGQFFSGDIDSIVDKWKINLEAVDKIDVDFSKATWPFANNSYTIYKIV